MNGMLTGAGPRGQMGRLNDFLSYQLKKKMCREVEKGMKKRKSLAERYFKMYHLSKRKKKSAKTLRGVNIVFHLSLKIRTVSVPS